MASDIVQPFALFSPNHVNFFSGNIENFSGDKTAEAVIGILTFGMTSDVKAEGAVFKEIGSAARAAADMAQAAGRTSGAAAELRVGETVFTDVSTGRAPRTINQTVQNALDKIPAEQRSPFHGACAEVGCLSQAADAKVNLPVGQARQLRFEAKVALRMVHLWMHVHLAAHC